MKFRQIRRKHVLFFDGRSFIDNFDTHETGRVTLYRFMASPLHKLHAP